MAPKNPRLHHSCAGNRLRLVNLLLPGTREARRAGAKKGETSWHCVRNNRFRDNQAPGCQWRQFSPAEYYCEVIPKPYFYHSEHIVKLKPSSSQRVASARVETKGLRASRALCRKGTSPRQPEAHTSSWWSHKTQHPFSSGR